MTHKHNDIKLFVDLLMLVEDADECEKLLLELLSQSEVDSITLRLKIASMLKMGKKYSDVIEETKASTTTISRVNKILDPNTTLYEMLKRKREKEKQELNIEKVAEQ